EAQGGAEPASIFATRRRARAISNAIPASVPRREPSQPAKAASMNWTRRPGLPAGRNDGEDDYELQEGPDRGQHANAGPAACRRHGRPKARPETEAGGRRPARRPARRSADTPRTAAPTRGR